MMHGMLQMEYDGCQYGRHLIKVTSHSHSLIMLISCCSLYVEKVECGEAGGHLICDLQYPCYHLHMALRSSCQYAEEGFLQAETNWITGSAWHHR